MAGANTSSTAGWSRIWCGRLISAAMGRAQILQCLRPERGPQGRHAVGGQQDLAPGSGRRDHIAVLIARSALPRWWSTERLRLCEGLRRCGSLAVGKSECQRPIQCRNRGRPQLPGSRPRGRSRDWPGAPDIRFVDMPARVRGKYQYFTQADMTKLRAAGFVQPLHSLENGIRDFVASGA